MAFKDPAIEDAHTLRFTDIVKADWPVMGGGV
jgi:hypothetical protein